MTATTPRIVEPIAGERVRLEYREGYADLPAYDGAVASTDRDGDFDFRSGDDGDVWTVCRAEQERGDVTVIVYTPCAGSTVAVGRVTDRRLNWPALTKTTCGHCGQSVSMYVEGLDLRVSQHEREVRP